MSYDLREINRINRWVGRKYLSHIAELTAASFRLIVLGLALPALVFAVAAAHFAGKHIAAMFGTLLTAGYLT